MDLYPPGASSDRNAPWNDDGRSDAIIDLAWDYRSDAEKIAEACANIGEDAFYLALNALAVNYYLGNVTQHTVLMEMHRIGKNMEPKVRAELEEMAEPVVDARAADSKWGYAA